jgi:hypothetical protein
VNDVDQFEDLQNCYGGNLDKEKKKELDKKRYDMRKIFYSSTYVGTDE